MKIVLTGSLGNIGRGLTERLIARKHEVSVVSHEPGRADAIRRLGATPLIGSVTDTAFLRDAFAGTEAAFTMAPPSFDAPDIHRYMRSVGDAYAEALEG